MHSKSPKYQNTIFQIHAGWRNYESPEKIAFLRWLTEEKNVDIHTVDAQGETPLFRCFNLPVLRQWLLDRGADLYHTNTQQETLLFKAIDYYQ